jgi:hypothetical protein
MSGHASACPLRTCVKVADYYDPFSAGILTYVKSFVTMFESVCATIYEHFAIVDRFFFFW